MKRFFVGIFGRLLESFGNSWQLWVALGSSFLMVKVFFCITFAKDLCFFLFYCFFVSFVLFFSYVLCFLLGCLFASSVVLVFCFQLLVFCLISSCFLRPYFCVGSARPLVPFSDGLDLLFVLSS